MDIYQPTLDYISNMPILKIWGGSQITSRTRCLFATA